MAEKNKSIDEVQLEELQSKVSIKLKEYEDAKEAVKNFQKEKLLPIASEKYLNKYFRITNRSCNSHWWQYKKVVEMLDHTSCVVIAFQKTDDDEYIFREKDMCFVSQLGEEITEEEWNNEYNLYLNQIEKQFI